MKIHQIEENFGGLSPGGRKRVVGRWNLQLVMIWILGFLISAIEELRSPTVGLWIIDGEQVEGFDVIVLSP